MDFTNSNAISKQWEYWGKVDAKLFNEASRLDTILEMTQLKYNQTIDDINTKIYVEGGTFDDASYLYTEAEAETNAKTGNIFMKFIETVKKIFTGLITKIKSMMGMLPDEDIEVKKQDAERVNIITSHFQKIAHAFDLAKQKDFVGAAKQLGLALIPELAVIAGVVVLKKSDLLNKCDLLSKVSNKAISILGDIKAFLDKNPLFAALKPAVNALKEFAQKGVELANNLFSGIHKGKDEEGNDDNGGKSWGDKKNAAGKNPVHHDRPQGPSNKLTDNQGGQKQIPGDINGVKKESYFDDIFGDDDMFTESYDFGF